MPRKPATEDQRQATRRILQKAAAGLYAESGAGAVSARAIAQRAGVSVGTIYSYFGSLQGLMQSLWMEPVRAINEQLAQSTAGISDPIIRIRSLLGAYVEVAMTRPELFRGAFLFVRPEALPKPGREPLENTPFASLLASAIRQGQTEGSIRSGDPVELAQLAWSAVHGCLALPVNFDRLAFAEGAGMAARMIDILIADLADGQHPA